MKNKSLRALLLLTIAVFLASCNLPRPDMGEATVPTFPAQTEGETSELIPATGTSCLVGDWRLMDVDEEWLSDLAQKASGRDVQIRSTSGTAGVQMLADGSMVIYGDDARMDATVPYQGRRLPVTITVNGTSNGNYTADENGNLTINDANISDVNVSARVFIIPVFSGNLSEMIGGYADATGSHTVQFICSADSLVITFDVPDAGPQSIQLERFR